MKKFTQIVLAFVLCLVLSLGVNAQNVITIGSGTGSTTTTQASPAANWWKNYRMQILYEASEFNTQGVVGQTWLNSIAFNVTGLPNLNPPGYTIRITTVPATQTTLTGTIAATNFTTVYNIPASQTQNFTLGWNTFNFTTPFLWNGTDNVVVEVCWGLIANYSQSGTVQTTNKNGQFRYYQSDFTSACPSNLTSSHSNRPNAQFNTTPFFVPCTGVPEAGIMSSYPPTPCVGKAFTLSLSGGTFASNYVYDWQEASVTAPTTFTTIPGSSTTANIYSTSFTVPKWYRVIVHCVASGLSDTTAPLFVDSGGFYACYCDPTFQTPNPAGYYIDSVAIDGTTLANGATGQGNNAYQIFPASGNTTCILQQNQNYTFSMSRGPLSSFDHVGGFWIDFNQDGSYDNVTEYFEVANPFIYFTHSKTFSVPTNLPAGKTGMRVIYTKTSFSGDPCLTNYEEGEVEDYVIEIDLPPCTNPSNPGVAFSTDDAICDGIDFTLIDTAHDENLIGLSYAWEQSTDGVNFTLIPNSNTDTLVTSILTPTWFRFATICNGVSTYSNQVFVDLLPSYACYCPSAATIYQEKSDIGAVKFGSFLLQDPGGSHLLNVDATRKYTSHLTKGPIIGKIDTTYEFSIYHVSMDSVHTNARVTMFIDFDRDGVFQSATERIFLGTSTATGYYLTGQVTIPNDAVLGLTGVRVIINEDTNPNVPSDEACGYYGAGETEDYLIEIIDPYLSTENIIEGLNRFSVYPNPNTTNNLSYYLNTNKKSTFLMKIQNVQGQILYSEEVQVSGDKLGVINIANMVDGLYLIQLTDENGNTTSEKFTILR